MPPAYVKPYVKRQKNDADAAEAICEAVTRANIRFSQTGFARIMAWPIELPAQPKAASFFAVQGQKSAGRANRRADPASRDLLYGLAARLRPGPREIGLSATSQTRHVA